MTRLIRVGVLDKQEVVHYGLRASCSDLSDIAVTGAYYRLCDALRAAEQGNIDILIMDYLLKGRDSLDSIRNLGIKYPDLRILMFLTDPCPATVTVLLGAGVHGVVCKCQPLDDCLQAIRLLASGQHYWGPSLGSIDLRDSLSHQAADSAETVLLSQPSLTLREREVLRLCISGLTVTSIAELSSRSLKTVSTQKQAAYRKLGFKNDMDLFRKLAQYGG